MSGARVTRARAAVAASVALSIAIGAFFAMAAAPWRTRDEQAHTGYAIALVRGQLPTVDTPIEVPAGAADLQWILDDLRQTYEPAGKDTRSTIWVANHPPGPYLLALPGTAWALRSDQGQDVVRWLRYANVAFTGLAVGFTALLARELTGRVDAAAAAAALVAATPYVGVTASAGMTDGATLAAVVAILWATARAVRTGFDRASTVVVACAAVACGASRLSALATGAAVVATGLVLATIRHRRLPWAAALAVLVAVITTTGWFYVRNIQLYGDPAASEHLLEKFARVPDGSVLDQALDWSTWEHMSRTLVARPTDAPRDPPPDSPLPRRLLASSVALAVVAVSVLVLAGHLLRRYRRRADRAPDDGPMPRRGFGWSLLVVAVAANWLMAAQHLSGGGIDHPRYLLVLVPAAACVVAAAACIAGDALAGPGRRRRWPLAVLLTAPFLALAALDLGTADVLFDVFERERAGAEIRRLGPTWGYRSAGVVAILAAAATAVLTARVAAVPDAGLASASTAHRPAHAAAPRSALGRRRRERAEARV